MEYPHINAIYYTLKTVENVSFENCKRVEYDQPTYKFSLDENTLKCKLKQHYSDIKSARDFIDPLLRAWEIDYALLYNREEFHFEFKNADIIKEELPSSGPKMICASIHVSAGCNSEIKAHVTRGTYPIPPNNFILDPEVETLWFRYNMYVEGKEQLLSMAYFCLSRLEALAGTRGKIPTTYYIERGVLDKLGDLTSERGDRTTARKGKDNQFIALTGVEETWVKDCIRLIIKRLGEINSLTNPPMIRLSDLPQI
ncbi:MAG: hypothetical protein K0Q49_2149 [Haloplasmataceae bacterium]|jgi:hypothetical protein|nr:hypothetical protein [Haloplasmataceae bacterium]